MGGGKNLGGARGQCSLCLLPPKPPLDVVLDNVQCAFSHANFWMKSKIFNSYPVFWPFTRNPWVCLIQILKKAKISIMYQCRAQGHFRYDNTSTDEAFGSSKIRQSLISSSFLKTKAVFAHCTETGQQEQFFRETRVLDVFCQQ